MAYYLTTLKSNLQLVCKIFDTFLNDYVADLTKIAYIYPLIYYFVTTDNNKILYRSKYTIHRTFLCYTYSKLK